MDNDKRRELYEHGDAEQFFRDRIGELDKRLQDVLPKAPVHPHLLHSREEWKEMIAAMKWTAGCGLTTEQVAKAVQRLGGWIDREMATGPTTYTLDLPRCGLRFETTDPEGFVKSVSKVRYEATKWGRLEVYDKEYDDLPRSERSEAHSREGA